VRTPEGTLVAKGVQATELGEHSGIASFAFSDNEGRWVRGHRRLR
jgi:hypothetical protein